MKKTLLFLWREKKVNNRVNLQNGEYNKSDGMKATNVGASFWSILPPHGKRLMRIMVFFAMLKQFLKLAKNEMYG